LKGRYQKDDKVLGRRVWSSTGSASPSLRIPHSATPTFPVFTEPWTLTPDRCLPIYVPQGDSADPTRSPPFYDATYRYLAEIGIPELK